MTASGLWRYNFAKNGKGLTNTNYAITGIIFHVKLKDWWSITYVSGRKVANRDYVTCLIIKSNHSALSTRRRNSGSPMNRSDSCNQLVGCMCSSGALIFDYWSNVLWLWRMVQCPDDEANHWPLLSQVVLGVAYNLLLWVIACNVPLCAALLVQHASPVFPGCLRCCQSHQTYIFKEPPDIHFTFLKNKKNTFNITIQI